MSDLVEVTRFLDATEAQIALGYLRSHDLDASLGEGHFAAQDSPLTMALGGIRLLVPAAVLPKARSLLAAAERQRPACPACGSLRLVAVPSGGPTRGGLLAFLSTLIAWAPYSAASDRRRCLDCNQLAGLDELRFAQEGQESPT